MRDAAFEHLQPLDHDGFLGRVRSSWYVAHGVADRAAFDRALEELFRRHEVGGRVAFAYRAVVAAFRPA